MPGLEIDSVDGFQGREKEAVVISLVRSNAAGEIGFLGDIRRMNVAMTRARRKLLLVGDSATLSSHPFYARMLEYFERQGPIIRCGKRREGRRAFGCGSLNTSHLRMGCEGPKNVPPPALQEDCKVVFSR